MKPDIELTVARYRLGHETANTLAAFADALLEGGTYSPSLYDLSVVKPAVMSEAGPLFERVCNELGVVIPSTEESIKWMIKRIIGDVASGKDAPRNGLHRLMAEVYTPFLSEEPVKEFVGDSRGLQHLIAQYYDYDILEFRRWEEPKNPSFGLDATKRIDQEVLKHARLWLDRFGGE